MFNTYTLFSMVSSTQTEQASFYILEKNLKPRNTRIDFGNNIILTKHIRFWDREVAQWLKTLVVQA